MKVTVLFLLLLSPHTFSLFHSGVLPQETESCSVGPFHELQFSKSCFSMCLYTGHVLSGADSSSIGPLWHPVFWQKTYSVMVPLLPRVTAPDGSQLSQGYSTGAQLLSGHKHLPWHWILHSWQSGCLLHHGSPLTAWGQLAPTCPLQRVQCPGMAQLSPVAGPSGSQLELVLWDLGTACSIFSQKQPLQPP